MTALGIIIVCIFFEKLFLTSHVLESEATIRIYYINVYEYFYINEIVQYFVNRSKNIEFLVS